MRSAMSGSCIIFLDVRFARSFQYYYGRLVRARDPILRAFHDGILLNAVKNLSGLILIDVAVPFVRVDLSNLSRREEVEVRR